MVSSIDNVPNKHQPQVLLTGVAYKPSERSLFKRIWEAIKDIFRFLFTTKYSVVDLSPFNPAEELAMKGRPDDLRSNPRVVTSLQPKKPSPVTSPVTSPATAKRNESAPAAAAAAAASVVPQQAVAPKKFDLPWQNRAVEEAVKVADKVTEAFFEHKLKARLTQAKTGSEGIPQLVASFAKKISLFYRVAQKHSQSLIDKQRVEDPVSPDLQTHLQWLLYDKFSNIPIDEDKYKDELLQAVVKEVERQASLANIQRKDAIGTIVGWLVNKKHETPLQVYLVAFGIDELEPAEVKDLVLIAMNALLDHKIDRLSEYIGNLLNGLDTVVFKVMKEKAEALVRVQMEKWVAILHEINPMATIDQFATIFVGHTQAMLEAKAAGKAAVQAYENDADTQRNRKKNVDFEQTKQAKNKEAYYNTFKSSGSCHPLVKNEMEKALIGREQDPALKEAELAYFDQKVENILNLIGFPSTEAEVDNWIHELGDVPTELTNLANQMKDLAKEITSPTLFGFMTDMSKNLLNYVNSPSNKMAIVNYARQLARDEIKRLLADQVKHFTDPNTITDLFVNQLMPILYNGLIKLFADLAFQEKIKEIKEKKLTINREELLKGLFDRVQQMAKRVDFEAIDIDQVKFNAIVKPMLADLEPISREKSQPSVSPQVPTNQQAQNTQSGDTPKEGSMLGKLIENVIAMIDVDFGDGGIREAIVSFLSNLFGKMIMSSVREVTAAPDVITSKVSVLANETLSPQVLKEMVLGNGMTQAMHFLHREMQRIAKELNKPGVEKTPRFDELLEEQRKYSDLYGQLSTVPANEVESVRIAALEARLNALEPVINARRREASFTDVALLLDDYARSLKESGNFFKRTVKSVLYQFVPDIGLVAKTLSNLYEQLVSDPLLVRNMIYRTTDEAIDLLAEKKKSIEKSKAISPAAAAAAPSASKA